MPGAAEAGPPRMLLSVRDLRRLHLAASFDLHTGECVVLRGASGSGKTQLLRAIASGAVASNSPAPSSIADRFMCISFPLSFRRSVTPASRDVGSREDEARSLQARFLRKYS